MHIGAWWQHECGVKILCSYDEAEDDIYMCDPYDESGKVVEPSTTAQKVMLKHFRTLAKAKKR
ncbi:hypothetical protein JCM19235_1280 [Vibrio maritimus]|uniref:Uncharacterized protein n=1 Tax=Vibrio maritimus TaxID=990268 RepID=A0A090S915_9VIBR|nr:hypothetical protein JCM19235_1280 [Vibrio maritimus]